MHYNSNHQSRPLTSLAFLMGSYSLSCSLDADQLRVTASLVQNATTTLNLTHFAQNPEGIEVVLQPLELAPSSPASSHHTQAVQSSQITLMDMQTKREENNAQMAALTQQLSRLEDQIGQLMSDSRPRRPSLQGNEEATETMKLEMLNELLQDKLLSKDNDIQKLNQRINEQEELIKELAEKLIVSNQDKEEMFS